MRPKKQTLLFGMASIWADSTPKMREKHGRASAAGMTPGIALLSLLAINKVMNGREPRKLPVIAIRCWQSSGQGNCPLCL
jgi:hypothetical protein